MNIDPKIFKSYDIRGIYPTEISEDVVFQIAKSIYQFISQKTGRVNPTILIGRDMRTSSPSLFESSKKALVEAGAQVIDADLVSTPTFYFAVFSKGYDGGMQISASHNPKEYNGVKIVMNSPKGLIKIGKPTGMEDIKNLSLKGVNSKNSGGKISKLENILEEEVENAIKLTGNPNIKEFNVVADAANAMGALYIDALFKKIPGKLIKMNFDLDGTFPAHQPDPLKKETLFELQKKVIEENADIGLAPDGDGDRHFFIDEKGQIVPPTIITSIVARELLKKNPGETILVDVRYILTPQKIIEENKGKTEITKVGHAYITEAMHKTGAIFAGESSAHFFFRETGNGESPMPVIITVLSVMTRENKKLSELVEELRRSFESGEINFKVSNASEIMEGLKKKYNDGSLSDIDGVAVNYPDWRFSVRTSNTEPLMRLNIEAKDKSAMEEKTDELIELIESLKK